MNLNSHPELDPQEAAFRRWAELYLQREQPGANHNVLAPREHGAYSELKVTENPLWALPMLGYVPAWTIGKSLGLLPGRSAPTIDAMAEGYRGIGRGLLGYFR